jgi:hypothetical protein
MPAHAPFTELPMPSAQSPDAIAIDKPAATGTHMLPLLLPPDAPPCANIGIAQNINAIIRIKNFVFICVTPSFD